jgi:hypothetical protein
LFARQGGSVLCALRSALCADKNIASAEETAALARQEGGQASAIVADVTRGEAGRWRRLAAGGRLKQS